MFISTRSASEAGPITGLILICPMYVMCSLAASIMVALAKHVSAPESYKPRIFCDADSISTFMYCSGEKSGLISAFSSSKIATVSKF